MSHTFIRLTSQERAVGLPLTDEPVSDGWADAATDVRESARESLEAILTAAVQRDRCYVLFSGGRDSSALLALATSVARSSGAPDPVPVTGRHPDAPESDETQWQDLVVRHLGLREHLVLDLDGEQGLLSDSSISSLRRRGLLWPTGLHVQPRYVRDLQPGGAIITGEGGDLTVSGRRITAIGAAVREGRPRRAARLLGPSIVPARPGKVGGEYAQTLPWLTSAGREAVAAMIRPRREPLGWGADLRRVVTRRPMRMGGANLVAIFADEGFEAVSPFDHPRFVRALAREGGFWGLGDRTALMRRLFGDLLPDAVLARTTKAAFNAVRFTGREREFARSWNGAGVDGTYVHPDRLRAAWLSEDAPPASAIHLHAAWLAENGLRWEPDGT